ncbi:hypothetical protein HHI36_013541 [Cryptolaemus montrouzieri]|uniref:Uncharacterized protein n=1 Tax=Cryptolaemus montrouzieri TaxID=559131 RepID=A0ABD2NIJ6_9CUCU
MSGIQIERCEIKNIDKDPLDAKNVLKFDTNSNNVALEVLNDIVENALDSAMYKEDQALRNFRMVGDIMDPYTPRSTKITELSDTPLTKNQKLTPTEEEVKKFIGEINSPTPKGTDDGEMENINLKDVPGNEDLDYIQKSLTFPIASCSRIPVLQQDKDCKERKKWNFGAKLVNYIKKKASRRDMTKSEV